MKRGIPNPNNKFLSFLPEWLYLYATSSVIIMSFAIFTTFFLITDNEPPSLPLPVRRPIIDCGAMNIKSYSVTGSKIAFNVSLGKFVQYPKSAAPSLLRVQSFTGKVVSEYTVKNFWDLTNDYDEITFNILHPFSGESRFTLACSTIPLVDINVTIDDVNIYSKGWTRFKHQDFSVMNALEMCWVNGSMLFSVTNGLMFNQFVFGHNITYNATLTKDPISTIAGAIKMPYAPSPKELENIPDVLLLGENPVFGWEKIVNLLIPIYCYSSDQRMQTLVLMKDQTDHIPLIQSVFKGNIIGTSTNQCFNNGIILPSSFSANYLENQTVYKNKSYYPSYQHFETITMLRKEVLNGIRDKITQRNQKPHTITLDSTCGSLANILKQLYPFAQINVINELDDIFVSAGVVARSSVFVGANLLSLSYSIFLKDGATIVEFVPNGQGCVSAGKRWADATGLNYVQLGNSDPSNSECTSKNLEEYIAKITNATFPNINVEQIREVFDPLMS